MTLRGDLEVARQEARQLRREIAETMCRLKEHLSNNPVPTNIAPIEEWVSWNLNRHRDIFEIILDLADVMARRYDEDC